MTGKTEPASWFPDSSYFLQDGQPVRMIHRVDSVEAEQDEIEGSARKHLQRSGIGHDKRQWIGICREPPLALADHAFRIIRSDIFTHASRKMQSCAPAPHAQVQHPSCPQFGQHQMENGLLRRKQGGLSCVDSCYSRKAVDVLISSHTS